MFQRLGETATDLWSMIEVRLIIGAAVVASLVAVAVYIIKRYRDAAYGGGADLNTHMTTFRHLRDEGKLDEEEFRRVKGTLKELTEQHFEEQSAEDDRTGLGN